MRVFFGKVSRFVRRHGRYFVAAGIFCLCALIFFVFWKLQVAEAQQKSRSVILNDAQEAATAPLVTDDILSQSFSHAGSFHGVGLVPVFTGEAPRGKLHMTLYDDDGNLLGEATGNAANTLSGGFAVFVFGETLESPDGEYRLEVKARLKGEGTTIAFAKSADTLSGWQLAAAGEDEDGSLCVMVSTDRIGGFLKGFYWVFALLGSGLCAGLYLLAKRQKCPLHRLVMVGILGLGLLFCMVLPPYAAPDEQFHINESFNLSAALTGDAPYNLPWGTTFRRAGDSNALIQEEHTGVFTYREIARNFFAGGGDGTLTEYAEEGAGGYRVLYWPAALVVTLCRLLGVGFVSTLYAGRLVNLLLFAFIMGMAVKVAPCGKSIFAAVGLLPISIHLGASFNRDGLVIALFSLYTALVLYYALEKPQLDGRDLALLAGLALVAGPAKVVYAPILFLCLFIPAEKLHFRGKALPRRVALLVKWLIPLAGCWSLLYTAAYQLKWLVRAVFVAPQQAAAAEAAGQPLPDYEPPPPEQNVFGPWDFIQKPTVVFWVIVRSLFTGFMGYLGAMVGASLGYNSLNLSWGFVVVLVGLLALSTLPNPDEKRPGTALRATGGLLALMVCGLLVVVALFWTPVTYPTLYGLQGRYFLPVLPLALCCLAPRAGFALQKTKDISRPLVLGFTGTGVFALLNAFLLILQN